LRNFLIFAPILNSTLNSMKNPAAKIEYSFILMDISEIV